MNIQEIFGKIKNARLRMAGFWAIEAKAFHQIKEVYSKFEENPKLFIQQVNDKENQPGAIGDLCGAEPQDLLEIEGNQATINIVGPLVDANDCATLSFGCTSFEDIRAAIQEVESMEEITLVIFNIDSPGGMVAGCDNTAIAIKNMHKHTEARVGNMAASAAFWLATQCNSITATSATASFGSIGVVVEFWDSVRFHTEAGHDHVCITSSGAPNKRLNPVSEEGERKIRADLDEIEKIFFRRVAEGRKTTTSIVGARFGKGGMFLAEKSKMVGMIDKTDFTLNNDINSNEMKDNQTEMETKMNLKQFLSENSGAQSEFDGLISAALKEDRKKHSEASEKRKTERKEINEKASKYLTGSYDKNISDLAVKVINGESSMESLDTVVAIFDKNKEENSSAAAASETEEINETPANVETLKSKESGAITDEESYQASVARLKKMRG